MKKFLLALAAITAVAVATDSHATSLKSAPTNKGTSNMTISQQPETISMGIGYHQIGSYATGGFLGASENLHAFAFRTYSSDRLILGADVAFGPNFNQLIFGPKANLIIKKFPNLDVYLSGALYLKTQPSMGLNIPLVAGIEIAIPGVEQVRFHTEHGLLIDLGSGSSIGTTQGLFGNYGIIYYF